MGNPLSCLILLLLAPAAIAAEPWLQFGNRDSQVYRNITVALHEDKAVVHIERNGGDDPVIDYTAALSREEIGWFRAVAKAINFANPDRKAFPLAGGHGGTYTVRLIIDGKTQEATYTQDEAFDDLTRLTFRLVAQAEALTTIAKRHLCYDALTALRNGTVLQPGAFVEPLKEYVLKEVAQVDHALEALALITTPETWGGIVTRAFDEAGDKPLAEGSKFTRRQMLQGVIAGHPFYSNLEDTHNLVLVRILRTQVAIEKQRGDKDNFAYRAEQAERELVKTAKR